MLVRLAGLVEESIVDGPGYRLAIFFQGCPHACIGCHNPKTHDLRGGYEADTDEIVKKIRQSSYIDGITLTGGEPLLQPRQALAFARAAKEKGLSVWLYTGFVYEDISDAETLELLKQVDVLVDGKFEIKLKSLELSFRGSSNQRLIDVQQSLKLGKTVLLSELD